MNDPAHTLATAARIGTVIAGKYDVVRLLGEGGMGAVYEAVHRFTRRRVAIKLLHTAVATSSPDAVARFLQEAQAPSSIGHDGIVEVLDAGHETDGTLYLVLELLEGGDLAATMANEVVTPSMLVIIAIQLLDALGAAHARGFVHRDIKPQNVFVSRDPQGMIRTRLLDFGIARQMDGGPATGLTTTGMILGTAYYISPEQARGQPVDGRADLWSLGAMLFHVLGGRPPFQADNYNLLIVQIITTPAPSLASVRPDLPAPLIAAVDRALRSDVSERWQTAAEMANALRGVVFETPEATRSPALKAAYAPTAAETPLQWSQKTAPAAEVDDESMPVSGLAPASRRSVPVILGAGALLGLVIVLGVHFGTERTAVPPARTQSHAPTPRPLYPASFGFVTSRRPTLRWMMPAGIEAATVELCRERACNTAITRTYVTGASTTVDHDLEPGIWFWRVRGLSRGQGGTETGAVWSFTVGPRSAATSTSAGAVPDVNGDGIADVIIGATRASGNVGQTVWYPGRLRGMATDAAATLNGQDGAYSYFGASVACAGDVNGDGYADVIIGAPEALNRAGRAYVYHGSAAGLANVPAAVLAGPDEANTLFGVSVASAGDVNGDGYADIIVGQPGAHDNAGRAYLYLGSPTGIPLRSTTTLMGPDGERGEFGSSIANAGDVNGDGHSDVIIGARGASHESGRAYLYYGSAVGLATIPAVALDGRNDVQAHFGHRVASAGDVNGDGFSDVAVSAPEADGAAGSVSIFTGGSTGISARPFVVLAAPDGPGGRFGAAIAGGSDLDSDGFSDIVISAPRWSHSTGRVYVYRGSGDMGGASPASVLAGSDDAGEFGAALAIVGDVDGDGHADLVVGAPEVRSHAGGAYLFRGGRAGVGSVSTTTFGTNAAPDSRFGYAIAGAL